MSKFRKNSINHNDQFFRTIGFENRHQSKMKFVFSVKDEYTSEEIFDIYFRLADEYEYVQNRFLSELFIEAGIRAELTAKAEDEADEFGMVNCDASNLDVYFTYDGEQADKFERKQEQISDILSSYLKTIKPKNRPFKISLR